MSGTHYPVGGTGYMDGIYFRFQISGQYPYANSVFRSAQGYVNLALEPVGGLVTEVYISAGNPVTEYITSLEQVPCSSMNAPD